MPSKSKIKGSAWERDVAKFLTEVYGETFIRVPSSGAYVGGINQARKKSLDEGQIAGRKGDVQPPDSWKHWNCECKFYADFAFHHLFTGEVKILDEWIAQMYDAQEDGDLNLIFMKFNRKGKWMMFENTSPLTVDIGINYKGWTFCSWDEFWNSSNAKQIRTSSHK